VRARPGGFTLLEVMLALALMSIILAALWGTFFVSERAVTATEEHLVRMHELRTVLDMVRREVEAALPAREGEYFFTVQDRDAYGARASRLSFTTHASAVAGPANVMYYAEEREGRLVLLKRMTSFRRDPQEGLEAVAVEEIKSFSVEVRDDNKWLGTWDGAPPREVRVTITVPLKDRSLTLSETMSLRIGRLI
jgi:general secretion pathway protein J